MFRKYLPFFALALIVVTSACGPAQLQPSYPQPLPSPSGSWSLSLTQSGGIAGVSLKVTVSSDGQLTAEDQRSGKTVTQTLPPDTMAKLAALYSAVAVSTPQSPKSGCADCFLYHLELNSGDKALSLKFDDTTLGGSGAEQLIHFLQQLRDAALKSQP
jgi:hypothetical protein